MNKRTLAITRAVGVIGASAALVVGITFANLGSTATLSNNTISTATAGLEVQIVDSGFAQSQQGFTITNLVPGQNSDPFYFNIRTTGAVPLTLTAHVPAVPTYGGFNPGGFSGVHIKITQFDNDAVVYADTTLADLLAGNVTINGGPLAGNSQIQLKAVAMIDSAVVTGSNAHVDGFDLVFSGTSL